MFAITGYSYRAIRSPDDLQPGEQLADEVPSALLDNIAEIQARTQRAALLRASDWTQLPDTPIATEVRAAWGEYRQALRDLPSDPMFPNCEWPTPPLTGGESADLG